MKALDVINDFDVRGKNILVLGAARTGLAVARALQIAGASVKVSDLKENELFKSSLLKLVEAGVNVEFGDQGTEQLIGIDMVVPSPGISPKVKILDEAIKRKIRIISEIEIASMLTETPIVGVTGTNGKTTVATLIGAIINKSSKKAIIGGNIGYPLIEAAIDTNEKDLIVAELSSFQLEFIERFRSHVAVLLNMTPDHLDWHVDLDDYFRAKLKIFANQRPGDFAIINDRLRDFDLGKIKSKKVFFSSTEVVEGCYLESGNIHFNLDGNRDLICKIEDIKIIGRHNLENCLAAIAAAYVLGIDKQSIVEAVRGFSGVAHRLEFVRNIDDVFYYNDSKATNPEAVIEAINSFERPVFLLAGGRSKGGSFSKLAEAASKKIKKAILFGESSNQLAGEFESRDIKTDVVKNMHEAVASASKEAKEGDVVLLSPACASFDMFKDFEDRGNAFKEAVNSLRES